uniref:Tetraacyldisaccharide 4'-kinase n=1 Tax=Candidatus Aschnera chinzeii TaxID=1485666 RepID=A0AAT9G562_9ENTR|nr:MAG: tetraacyldisaccharide 4'-kinase [Candidatus Aschnera chinzeii]
MIQKIWKKYSWYTIFLLIISLFYLLICTIRKYCYKIGLFHTWKASIPIVIVGNITVGGTGKTPVVIWLVQKLLSYGYNVGVVSYGYKSKSKKYPLIITEKLSIKESGDEAALIYKNTGVPIAIAPKRICAVKILLKYNKLDIIIADDGLQHYALERDYEIVVIDGINRFGNGLLLPAGPLRETQNRLKLVNIIINNSGVNKNNEIHMQLTGNIAINMVTGKKKIINIFNNVVAIAGIGNPKSFFLNLKNNGVKIVNTYIFPDHHNYTLYQLNKLINKNQILLMTEKDAVKCFHFAQDNWWYLPVTATFSKHDTKNIIHSIIQLIKKNKKITN